MVCAAACSVPETDQVANATEQPTEFVITDSDVCSECPADLVHEVTLGRPEDPTSIGLFAEVSRTPDGAYFVAPSITGSEILSFGADGEYKRTVGRSGQGPGEFSRRVMPPIVLENGDMMVHDVLARRLTLFSPDYSVESTHPLPFNATTVFPAGENRYLVHGWALSRLADDDRRPLHIFDLDSGRTTSFGDVLPEQFTAGRPFPAFLGMPTDESVWVGTHYVYEVQEWGLDGRRGRQVTRIAEWFPRPPPDSQIPDRNHNVRPEPWLQGVHEDAEGRLWMVILVADSEWRAPSGEDHERIVEYSPSRLLDTVIEVLSTQRPAKVIARLRTPLALLMVRHAGRTPFFYSIGSNAVGGQQVKVWRGTIPD